MELQFTELKSLETERGLQEFVCVTVGNFVNITLNIATTRDGRKFCSLPSKKFGDVYDPIVYLLDRTAEKAMLDAATKWYHQRKTSVSVDTAPLSTVPFAQQAAFAPLDPIVDIPF